MKVNCIVNFFCILFFVGCNANYSWIDAELGEPVYKKTGQKELTSVDPEKGGFPGGRGTNHLVAYTPAYGDKTGTNEWGGEAIVKNGIVVSMGGNNSFIPKDGFVISGNENACVWINKNLTVGMEVVLDGDKLVFTSSENTYIIQARLTYKKVLKRVEKGRMTDKKAVSRFNNQANEKFRDLMNEKKKNNTDIVVKRAEELLDVTRKLYYSSFEPKEDEFKGVWIRLADKTPQQLRNTIKRMAEAGINAILPETIYNGHTIYPNAHPLLPQWPQFKGWDPMKVMMEECEKYKIKVIPWCEMFFVGLKNSPVVKQKPEWVGKFRHGDISAVLEPGFVYLCPSRPEVSEFLLTTVDTLLTRYNVKEVQLDYIRYSLSEPWDKGFCYCDYCRNMVKQKLNFDIMEISPENEKEWRLWNEYRADNVTGFVENVNSLLMKKHPKVKLSVDVVPNPKNSLDLKFQDWGKWVKKNMVDVVYIMSYAFDNMTVNEDAGSLMNIINGTDVSPVVGLGPYLGYKPETLLEQIEVARDNGAKGVCLFSFNALTQQQIDALKFGPFRK